MRRPVRFCLLTVFAAAWLLACGGGAPSPSSGRLSSKTAPSVVAPPAEPGPRAWVARASVDRALRAGLGRVLANAEVDAQLDGARRFVGWRIVVLHDEPDDMWKGVDLRVGDVVTAVNGFPLERPQQADRAFQSLRVSSEIRVSLLREGKPMELRIAIVEEGEPPPTDAAASAVPATSASVLPTPGPSMSATSKRGTSASAPPVASASAAPAPSNAKKPSTK
jgi:hypothetical protein